MKKILLTKPNRIMEGLSRDLYVGTIGIYCLIAFVLKICYLPIAYLLMAYHYLNAKTGFIWKFWRAIGYKNKGYKVANQIELEEAEQRHFGIKMPHDVYKVLVDYMNWVSE